MIVSWYQFALFTDTNLIADSDLTGDNDFINDLNSELDWWEYQQETWLAIGKHHLFVHLYVYHFPWADATFLGFLFCHSVSESDYWVIYILNFRGLHLGIYHMYSPKVCGTKFPQKASKQDFRVIYFTNYVGRYQKNNYAVGCDIHNYIFMKANILAKSVKNLCHENFRL